jgi:N-acyl-D-amino-acid deacylase
MFDLVIRNGNIIDGSNNGAYTSDIGIIGERIAAIGPALGPGKRELDASGLLVTPGWVDMHTHYDGQVTWDEHLSPSGSHGVTTVVMGNCGVGFAPCRKEHRSWLINVMEGVEDIPGAALSEGIKWNWETFPEYMDAIENSKHSVDFATQLPHSAVRAYVMGTDDSEDREATPEEIEEMSRIVEEGLRAGALGFSTSRTSLHKTAAGKLVAGTFAGRDELFGIGQALKRANTGVFECANEHMTLDTDIDWMEELAFEIDRPVIFNLSQTDFNPTLWSDVLKKLGEAADRGAPLYAQAAGRSIGIVMGFQATAHPFALKPSFQQLMERPWAEAIAELKRPEVREQILTEEPVEANFFENFVTQSFSKMYDLSTSGYEPELSENLDARATESGISAAELAYDTMLQNEGTGFLYFPLFNYTDGNLELLREMHQHPRVKMGLSDGGAHCGAICDGGMPTFMLTHWTRDRSRGETLPLAFMIHRQTQQTAEFYGLNDRGLLKVGYRADVNLIDYEQLSLDLPEMVFDLPAGGRRLLQRARGYKATICRGQVTFEDGEPTGALPGKLLRGSQPAPSTSDAEAIALSPNALASVDGHVGR